MGDILEDVKMVKAEKHDIILRIGFLNCLKTQSHLKEEFENTFDLVIVGDGSL